MASQAISASSKAWLCDLLIPIALLAPQQLIWCSLTTQSDGELHALSNFGKAPFGPLQSTGPIPPAPLLDPVPVGPLPLVELPPTPPPGPVALEPELAAVSWPTRTVDDPHPPLRTSQLAAPMTEIKPKENEVLFMLVP